MISIVKISCIIDILCRFNLLSGRCGSRKVFAVDESNLEHTMRSNLGKGKKTKKHDFISLSSSDDDIPSSKKRKEVDVLQEIKSIKHDIKGVLKLSKGMNLPPGLYAHLEEAFKCHICHSSPMELPAIFTRCCRNIVGCAVCVDAWYKSNSKCPLCRADRALPDTCPINGLDNLITAISPLFNADEKLDCSDVPGPSGVNPPLISHDSDDSDFDFELSSRSRFH